MIRRPVVVESPYAGDVEANVEYAQRALLDCLSRGEAPLASHLLYTQVLDDDNEAERTQGIEAGHAWIPMAIAVVLYIDLGVSPGMMAAIEVAKMNDVLIEMRSLPDVP